MIGGASTLGPGGYGGSELERILPVELGPRRRDRQEATPFLPRLTADGKAHPIFTGLTDFFPDATTTAATQTGDALPPLLGCVLVDGIKAGASVLAEHPSRQHEGRAVPVLIGQQFGSGRTAVFTADISSGTDENSNENLSVTSDQDSVTVQAAPTYELTSTLDATPAAVEPAETTTVTMDVQNTGNTAINTISPSCEFPFTLKET